MRLLEDLGYDDKEIKTKKAIPTLVISLGRRKQPWKPDFMLECQNTPRWILDAKSSDEDVDDWVGQCSSYCLTLNRKYTGEKPLRYYAITNGIVFKVFKWDEETAVLTLGFSDLVDGNQRFIALRSLLGAVSVRKGWSKASEKKVETITFAKPPIEEVKRVFNVCHRIVWKTEKMSPQPAFFEFVKIMFVKLWEDRRLLDDSQLGPLIREGKPIPKERIVFSAQWIDEVEGQGIASPINQLFEQLLEKLNEAVAKQEKKPIFNKDEKIKLSSGTVRQVVGKLENYNLFGIDEDLNGRLFETFLSATMRGEALGQYFTPRSIVKLMEKIAAPIANRTKLEKTLDGCCGTGGFLIEVLTDMRNQVKNNTSLTKQEQDELMDKIANESIYGIDAGRDPPIARIARINMYLHGDGGSRIYAADALDKKVTTYAETGSEAKLELEELQDILGASTTPARIFDIVLTNPPFSMDYSIALPHEATVLSQYRLAKYELDETAKSRPSLRSSIMFIERHGELVKPNEGRLITVIDDSVLSGSRYRFARKYLRENFIIRAVISLHGDAFQRVGARAKTSIIYLIPRSDGDKSQPDVFMWESEFVGLDDVPPKTRPSKAMEARLKAEEEIEQIVAAFKRYQLGEKGLWLVPSSAIADRLDVKSCLPRPRSVEDEWKRQGIDILPLESVAEHITQGGFNPRERPYERYALLRITYEGIPQEGEKVLGGELTYDHVLNPKANDIVMSNIAVALGSSAVIPEELQHCIVSSEFTIMRIKDPRFYSWFLWGYLRSPEVRARLLSKATGIARHRAGWDALKIIPVPLIDPSVQKEIGDRYKEAVEALRVAEVNRTTASTQLNEMLNVENEWAMRRLRTAKPPK